MRMLITLAAAAAMLPCAAGAQMWPRAEPSNPRGGPLDLGPQRYAYPAPHASGWDAWNLRQLALWGVAGKCVVGRDRAASLALVSAKAGSAEARTAARRLDQAFAACLAGSGIVAGGNFALRRAAVADALGVRPTA